MAAVLLPTSSKPMPDDFSCYNHISVTVLRNRARRTLSMFLNLKAQVPADSYYMPDFTGVAELIGYEYLETCNFERSADPMGMILDDWGSGTRPNATVGRLCKILQDLGRVDVLTSVWPVIGKPNN